MRHKDFYPSPQKNMSPFWLAIKRGFFYPPTSCMDQCLLLSNFSLGRLPLSDIQFCFTGYLDHHRWPIRFNSRCTQTQLWSRHLRYNHSYISTQRTASPITSQIWWTTLLVLCALPPNKISSGSAIGSISKQYNFKCSDIPSNVM